MKLFYRKTTLYRQFMIAFSFVILIPIVVISIFGYKKSVQQLEAQTKKMLEQILIDTNSQMDKEIRDYTWIINRVLMSNEIYDFLQKDPKDSYAKLEFSRWMNSMVFKDFFLDKSFVDGIAIIGSSGANYIDYRTDSLNNSEFYDKKLLKNLEKTLTKDGKTKIFITGLNENQNSKSESSQFLVTIGRRIISLNTMKPIGTFYLNLRSSALSDIWENVDMQEGFLWITNEEGIIIYHPDIKVTGKRAQSIVDLDVIKKGKGTFKSPAQSKELQNRESQNRELQNGESQRIEYFFVSHTSDYTGWRVISSIPMSQMRRPAENIEYVILFTSLIVFPCALGLGFLFFRSIVNPIKEIQQNMKDVGKGIWRRIDKKVPQNEISNLVDGFNSMVDKIAELIDRVYVSEREKHEEELARQKSEMQALQMQINPHFLYNTLANINAYSEVNDREAIQNIVKSLAKMFKYAVLNPMEPVKVKDEIEHVTNYLIIQKYRYQKVVNVKWNVNGFENYQMLRLTLQPLFENVFKHAFPDGIEPWHIITVDVYKHENSLVIAVSDNGVGTALDIKDMEFVPDNKNGKGGIGLTNVNRRIKLAYGDNYGLKISGKKGEGTIIKIIIPLIELENS